MEELQVPTRRVSVEVFTDQGDQIRGSLFVTESPYHTWLPDDVLDTLNDERVFLPFASEDPSSGNGVLNKGHVLRVRCGDVMTARNADERAAEATDGVACTLSLADGSRVSGSLVIQTPESNSRLLDKLNQAQPFVKVLTVEGVDFVRLEQIVRAA